MTCLLECQFVCMTVVTVKPSFHPSASCTRTARSDGREFNMYFRANSLRHSNYTSHRPQPSSWHYWSPVNDRHSMINFGPPMDRLRQTRVIETSGHSEWGLDDIINSWRLRHTQIPIKTCKGCMVQAQFILFTGSWLPVSDKLIGCWDQVGIEPYIPALYAYKHIQYCRVILPHVLPLLSRGGGILLSVYSPTEK